MEVKKETTNATSTGIAGETSTPEIGKYIITPRKKSQESSNGNAVGGADILHIPTFRATYGLLSLVVLVHIE
jgi:hypothetical protein